jgi:hypothetical protein
MHSRRLDKPFFSALLILLPVQVLPINAIAQTRGGACQSSICEITGSIVLMALLGFFLISIAQYISVRGFLAGISSHPVVKILFYYVLSVGGVLLIASAAYQLAGEVGGVLAMIALMVLISFLEKRRKPKY